MAIKIIPLKKAFPGSGYDSNKKKSFMFAHAGGDYWRACHILIDKRNKEGPWLMYAELPLMHMAMELLIKAFPALFDHEFNSKKYKHSTSKIIREYSSQINILGLIESDASKMELIKGLENSWEPVRYAESAISYDGSDWKTFNEIIVMLLDEYKKLTGLRI